jgi:hypothetical protein
MQGSDCPSNTSAIIYFGDESTNQTAALSYSATAPFTWKFATFTDGTKVTAGDKIHLSVCPTTAKSGDQCASTPGGGITVGGATSWNPLNWLGTVLFGR